MKEGVDVFDRVDPLRWTTEKPTVAGWYWWHNVSANEKMIVDIDEWLGGGLVATVEGRIMIIADMPGEWAGPIQEP